MDVSELLQHPGTTRQLDLDIPLEGLSVQLAEVERGTQVRGDLRMDSLVNGIHVTGRVRGRVVIHCRRCLKELPQQLDLSVNEMFIVESEDVEAADSYIIEGESMDLEPMLRDVVVLGLPLNPLCVEGCKGLCPVCGADRNETVCGHSGEPVDVRWGALEGLREKMEG